MRLILEIVILLCLFAVLVLITSAFVLTVVKNKNDSFEIIEVGKADYIKKTHTVGFCFLLGNEVSFPEIWQTCFDWLVSKGLKIQVWIHEKERTDNLYFPEAHKIDVIPTGWGGTSLVRACAHLMFAAFESGCDQTYFVSGDTVPILQNVSALLTNRKSCFQCSTVVSSQDRSRYHLNRIFPNAQKQNMFFSSTKDDFLFVFPNKAVFERELVKFSSVFASDEWFFINNYQKHDRQILKLQNFILVNPSTANETQAVIWSAGKLTRYKSKISKFVFLRKVTRSTTLPRFMTELTVET